MARPAIPETDKKRTVPFRMTKPDYRGLTVLMKITDTTIQEHLREALHAHLDRELKRVGEGLTFKLPSTYEMGAWSDDAFGQFVGKIGATAPSIEPKREPVPTKAPSRFPKIGGNFKSRQAA